jgi:hypothetical protein
MSIKFDCTCGQRIKARDGSAGRQVRCPRCRAEFAVPGGDDPGGSLSPAGGEGFGRGVQAALRWQDDRGSRRARPEGRRVVTAAEQWLMEHGVWVPLGVAILALFGVVGLVGYAAELPTLVEFCAFMLLIGLGSLVYGLFDLRQLAGVKGEKDRPGGDGSGP